MSFDDRMNIHVCVMLSCNLIEIKITCHHHSITYDYTHYKLLTCKCILISLSWEILSRIIMKKFIINFSCREQKPVSVKNEWKMKEKATFHFHSWLILKSCQRSFHSTLSIYVVDVELSLKGRKWWWWWWWYWLS